MNIRAQLLNDNKMAKVKLKYGEPLKFPTCGNLELKPGEVTEVPDRFLAKLKKSNVVEEVSGEGHKRTKKPKGD